MKRVLLVVLAALLFLSSCDDAGDSTSLSLSVESNMVYDTGIYDESAAEIVYYDSTNDRILFTNGSEGSVNILTETNGELSLESGDSLIFGDGDANSVSVYNGVAAVAVAAADKTDDGSVYFVDVATGTSLGAVTVGALPDMVTFTPDGSYVLVANEGEPEEEYAADPEGSVSIIEVELADTLSDSTFTLVDTVTFDSSDLEEDGDGVEVRTSEYLADWTGYPGTYSVANDIEPEYIAVDSDSLYAYVACQENNAIAKIYIPTGKAVTVKSLGYKDYSDGDVGVDLYNDEIACVESRPYYGLYMPDAICTFEVGGETYIATANEGDDRADWEDDTDIEDHDCTKAKNLEDDFGLTLDDVFKDSTTGEILDDYSSLKVSPYDCIDSDDDGDIDILVGFGARSFSIWDEDLDLVYDSGSLFETYTVENYPDYSNCSNDNLVIDDRSSKKGPEPEAITAGEVDGIPVLFVGLERFGGFFAFDVSDPEEPEMLLYHTDRNFDATIDSDLEYSSDDSLDNTGDLGPEGFCFISSDDSSDGTAKLIVGSEVSGTVRVYDVEYN
ncbi:MAG: choice-of-anchor I family protein [Spirochaetales bacterium]|nr:choice-of-anchor I family protein [Spirochaetales bacterium]